MDKWHGWSLAGHDESLHIGALPGRSQVALYINRNAEIEILAYFRSEEMARKMLLYLDEFTDLANRAAEVLRGGGDS